MEYGLVLASLLSQFLLSWFVAFLSSKSLLPSSSSPTVGTNQLSGWMLSDKDYTIHSQQGGNMVLHRQDIRNSYLGAAIFEVLGGQIPRKSKANFVSAGQALSLASLQGHSSCFSANTLVDSLKLYCYISFQRVLRNACLMTANIF